MATQVPIRVLLTDSTLAEHEVLKPQLEKLIEAGHTVVIDDGLKQYDFITGPNCWILRPELVGLFSVAVKQMKVIANADKERVEQVEAAKAIKRKPRKPGKARTRNPKVEAVIEAAGPNSVDTDANSGGDTESK